MVAKITPLLASVCLLLSACIVHVDDNDDEPSWRTRERDNQALIQQLELGVSAEVVYQRLGPADVTEAFMDRDHEYRILRYRTQHRHSDGETTDDETTPLLFEDGRLVGWGEHAIRSTLHERGYESTH